MTFLFLFFLNFFFISNFIFSILNESKYNKRLFIFLVINFLYSAKFPNYVQFTFLRKKMNAKFFFFTYTLTLGNKSLKKSFKRKSLEQENKRNYFPALLTKLNGIRGKYNRKAFTNTTFTQLSFFFKKLYLFFRDVYSLEKFLAMNKK